jgi:uncharacterized LabA/DUF88 family protein
MKIEEFFSELTHHLLAAILSQSLSHLELIALCRELKVETPGYRLEKLGPGDLIGHLRDDARKRPDLLPRLQAALDRANRECRDRQGREGANKIRSSLRGWLNLLERGEFGPRLWAALRDERIAVNLIARKTIAEFGAEAKAALDSPPPPVRLPEADAPAAKKTEEGEGETLRGLRNLIDELRRVGENGEKEVRALEKTLRKSSAEAQKARDLARKRLEEVKEKEGEIIRIKTALKEREAEEQNARRMLESQRPADRPDDLSSHLHALEKNLRRTEHDLKVAENAAREAAVLRKKIEEDRLTINLAEREKIQAEKNLRGREEELAGLRERLRALEFAKKPAAPTRPPREEERLGIFVDVQNVYYTVRDFLGGGRMDYDELRTRVAGGRKIVRAIAYVVQADFGDPESFFQMLQFKGFQVKRRPLKVRADRSMKGNWDMGMALDLIKYADDLDTIALLSGDGDFTEIVPYLKKKGCRVEVCAVKRATARELEQAADCFTPIDGEWLLNKKGSNGASE